MRKEYMLRVRMTAVELETLDEARGEVTRSEYVRSFLPDALPKKVKKSASSALPPPEPEPEKYALKTCKHGVLVSENNCCYCEAEKYRKPKK